MPYMGGGQGSGSLWDVHEQLQSLVPMVCDSRHPTAAVCDMHLCHMSSLLIMLETFTSYKGGVSCSAIQLQ